MCCNSTVRFARHQTSFAISWIFNRNLNKIPPKSKLLFLIFYSNLIATFKCGIHSDQILNYLYAFGLATISHFAVLFSAVIIWLLCESEISI